MNYDVIEVVHFVDGDTLWLRRRWVVAQMEEFRLVGEDYLGGIKVRLHDGGKGLNTPERGETGWAQASTDMQDWVSTTFLWKIPLTLVTYGKDGFGRTLGNLVRPDGNDVVRFMISKGWKTYK